MGSGSSSRRAVPDDRIALGPTVDPLRRQPNPGQARGYNQNHEIRRRTIETPLANTSTENTNISWPLPPLEKHKGFHPDWPENMDRYSLEPLYLLKVPRETNRSQIPQLLDVNSGTKAAQYHQEERITNEWKEEVNSSVHDSAHVQSKLNAQSQAYLNLSGTSEMIRAISVRNDIHKRMNKRIADKTELLSKEAQCIIETITVDTSVIEKNLLAYAKERQLRQDELYREWLQKYVAELDKWKSQQMSKLQDELERYHKEILAYSQGLIAKVYQDEDEIKMNILKEEQEQGSFEIKSLMAQIESSSEHQLLQNVGSEVITNIRLTIHSGAGRILATPRPSIDHQPSVQRKTKNRTPL